MNISTDTTETTFWHHDIQLHGAEVESYPFRIWGIRDEDGTVIPTVKCRAGHVHQNICHGSSGFDYCGECDGSIDELRWHANLGVEPMEFKGEGNRWYIQDRDYNWTRVVPA